MQNLFTAAHKNVFLAATFSRRILEKVSGNFEGTGATTGHDSP